MTSSTKTWHERLVEVQGRIRAQMKPHSRLRKRLRVSRTRFKQWRSQRFVKLKEATMKINLTGGAIIIAIELLLTFGGALIISLFETDPSALQNSYWGLTVFNMDLWQFNLAQLWLLGGLIYTGLSFRFDQIIQAEKLAVRTLFGQPTDTVGSGLPIVPPFLFDLRVFTARVQQTEKPAEPEKIFRKEDVENVPEGMFPPFRVTFTESITDAQARNIFGEGDNGEYSVTVEYNATNTRIYTFRADAPNDGLSNRRTTEEVVVVIRWRIEDAISFVKYIGSELEAEKQLEDEVFTVVQRVYPKISLAQALGNVDWMNTILYNALMRRVGEIGDRSKSWGVHIESVNIKNIRVHHGLNDAIANAAKADFEGKQRERLAETDRIEREKKGQGDAAAQRLILEARADGYNAIAKKTRVQGGDAAMRTEAARELANAGNLVVSDTNSGVGSLLGLVGAGSAVAKREKTSDGNQSTGDTQPSNGGESS